MHPAFSVIFFTTASGAGYGLLALLGISTTFGWLPHDDTLIVVAGIAALVLVTGGLLSSTFHLGHPERAWRALTQWRSSWLSREGVMAMVTFIPAVVFLGASLKAGSPGALLGVAGTLIALCAIITVFTTAMIYASLRSIDAWHNAWVPVVYLILAAASGMALLNAFIAWFNGPSTTATTVVVIMLAGALITKLGYWRYIDTPNGGSTATSAIGVDRKSQVKLTQAPHSQENYLQREMGFVIARRHAHKLRRIALLMACVLPIALSLGVYAGSPGIAKAVTVLAILSLAIGLLVERWLFFAEAKHTVSLYY